MWANYFLSALRHLRRHRSYSLVSIFGLAVGLACFLLIGLYVQHELSYDRFHEKASRIYQLTTRWNEIGGTAKTAWSPAPLAELVERSLPQIEMAARLFEPSETVRIRKANQSFKESGLLYGEPAVFRIFDFELLRGNPEALSRPHTLFISHSTAEKYFPEADPIGKKLQVEEDTYEIKGVFADVPPNSHLQFSILASSSSLPRSSLAWSRRAYTYLLLAESASPDQLEKQFARLAGPQAENALGVASVLTLAEQPFDLAPLTKLHLFADLEGSQTPPSSPLLVYLFSAIALLVLIIACINYTNLAIARSIKRAKEVGVRKSLGATPQQLAWQFLVEAVIVSTGALALGALLAQIFRPVLSSLMGHSIALSISWSWLLVLLAALSLLVGLGAGSYPALYLARFQAATVLSGKRKNPSSQVLRRGLVVFQLGVTVVLIFGALVITQQMNFVSRSHSGFEEDKVVMIPTQRKLGERYFPFKNELLERPQIKSVTTTSYRAGEPELRIFFPARSVDGLRGDRRVEVDGFRVGKDFLKTFGIELKAGQSFSEVERDPSYIAIINEAAANEFGWEEPVGKHLSAYAQKRTVIGVVENFHSRSLKESVEPAILVPIDTTAKYVAVRTATDDLSRTLARIESQWKRVAPGAVFTYSFLDKDFASMYRTEERLRRLFLLFSVVAILIAGLGLFALSALEAERRTKEIGIRKALGAPVVSVVALLTRDVLKLAALAFALSAPLAYLGMREWAANFAYQADGGLRMLLVAGAIATGAALVAISYQVTKVALTNPVDTLRYE